MSKQPFTIHTVTSIVNYEINNPDYKVKHVKIIEDSIYKFKNIEQYLHKIINYIKDNIIKYCKELKLVKIYINFYDQLNIFHRLFVTVSNILASILKEDIKFNINKSIIIQIMYEDNIVFGTNIDPLLF